MAEDWEVKLIRSPTFRGMAPDRQKVVYQEASKRFGGQTAPAPTAPQPTGLMGAMQRTDQLIEERPSRIAQATQLYGEQPGNIAKHPVGFGLNMLGSGWEAMESVPANALLGIQRGQPLKETAGDILSGLRGRRPAQFGDVMRSVGTPEPIAAATGLALTPGGAKGMVEGGKLAIGAGRGAMKLAGQGIQGVKTGAGNMVNFLRGNPRGIEQAERGLGEAEGSLIRSYRRGGANFPTSKQTIQAVSEEAWAPAEQAARSVESRIPVDQLKELAYRKFPDPEDAQRLQALTSTLDDMVKAKGGEMTFTGQELLDASSAMGRGMRRGTVQGGGRPQFDDVLRGDARSILLDAIETNAPSESKGLIGQAFQKYRDYATVANQYYRTVRPNAGQLEQIGQGAGTLKRASGVKGQAQPESVLDSETIVNNIQKLFGIDLRKPLEAQVKALQQAEKVGRRGKTTRTLGTLGLGGGGLWTALNQK